MSERAWGNLVICWPAVFFLGGGTVILRFFMFARSVEGRAVFGVNG